MRKFSCKKVLFLTAAALVLCLCVLLSACGTSSSKDRRSFDEETTYYFRSGSAVGMEIDGYIDEENSFIRFSPNGKMCLQLTPNAYIIFVANTYLKDNKNDLAGISFSDMERYTSEVLPGESFFLLADALEKLGDSLGVKINGIDFNSEKAQAFFAKFEENHDKLPNLVLPNELNVTIEADYGLCTIPTDFSDEPYDAIFLGDYGGPEDDPFFLLTRYITDDGKEALFLYNEMLSLRIDFVRQG